MVKHNIIIVANLTLIIHVYMWLFFGLCNIIIFLKIVLQLYIIIIINKIDSLLYMRIHLYNNNNIIMILRFQSELI